MLVTPVKISLFLFLELKQDKKENKSKKQVKTRKILIPKI